jgi:hypothetical protein
MGSNNPTIKSNYEFFKKEKEKRIKERKNNLSKLTKDLAEAKKIYEEKNKKNLSYFNENIVKQYNIEFI